VAQFAIPCGGKNSTRRIEESLGSIWPPAGLADRAVIVGYWDLVIGPAPVARFPAAGRRELAKLAGVFAEFENNLRRERQMEGINAAKARGVYKGRKPSIKPDEVRRLRKEGLGATEIARKLGVGRASVYRVLMR
jgi:Helix-turn-helix domain of resolvase